MEPPDNSEPTNKARTARRLPMDLPSLRRPSSSSHPLRGGCLTCAEHVRQFEGASPLPNLMEVKG